MPNIFRKQYDVKLPQPNRESKHEEYWIEHKGITKCPKCGNVHFLKQWFASEKDLKNHFKKRLHRNKLDEVELKNITKRKLDIAEVKICPACSMIENNVFEGEILVETIPEAHKKKILAVIKNFGKIATKEDPQDRIIDIEDFNEGYRVTATDNGTADKLAKKIHHAFRNTSVEYSHGPGPDNVDRIRVIFT
jgi:NMD protein affecting ribosome stability and mRNA decay